MATWKERSRSDPRPDVSAGIKVDVLFHDAMAYETLLAEHVPWDAVVLWRHHDGATAQLSNNGPRGYH
jgi:hypothetical protein